MEILLVRISPTLAVGERIAALNVNPLNSNETLNWNYFFPIHTTLCNSSTSITCESLTVTMAQPMI